MSVLSLSHLCIKAVGSRYFVIQSLTFTRMISSFVFLRVYFAITISHYGSASQPKSKCYSYTSLKSEMFSESERDSPLKHLFRRTHVKLARLAGSGQLVWAAGCELMSALVHAQRPAWPGETSETALRVAPPRTTRPPCHTQVNSSISQRFFP